MNKRHLLVIAVSGLLLSACSLNMSPSTPPASSETGAAVEALPTLPDSKMYNLTSQNNSGQTGTLTLTETPEGKTSAVLALSGGTFPQPQPAHIHVGACPNPGAAKFPLTNVINGQSTTILDTSLADLLASAPELAVNVHKSEAEVKVYTACADLK